MNHYIYRIELDYWVEAYGSPYEVERIKPTEAFMLEMSARGFSPQDAAAEWVSQILDSLQLEFGNNIKNLQYYKTIHDLPPKKS